MNEIISAHEGIRHVEAAELPVYVEELDPNRQNLARLEEMKDECRWLGAGAIALSISGSICAGFAHELADKTQYLKALSMSVATLYSFNSAAYFNRTRRHETVKAKHFAKQHGLDY